MGNFEAAIQDDMAARVRDMLGPELVPVRLGMQFVCALPFLWRALDLYLLSPGGTYVPITAAAQYGIGALVVNPLLITITAAGLQVAPLWLLRLSFDWRPRSRCMQNIFEYAKPFFLPFLVGMVHRFLFVITWSRLEASMHGPKLQW